jgi:hypothetical protein
MPALSPTLAGAVVGGWGYLRRMDGVRITTAFIPVADLGASAGWYGRVLGFRVHTIDEWSAVLRSGDGSTSLTLLGPSSGIQAKPGLPWATCNFAVPDIDQARSDLQGRGCEPTAIEGTPEICLFFTVQDPDNNTLLITDR